MRSAEISSAGSASWACAWIWQDRCWQYVNYSPKGLIQQLRKTVEVALRKGLMTLEASRQLISSYQQGLEGYTYLERD